MKKLLQNETLSRSFLALLCGFFLLQIAKAQFPPSSWTSQTSAADNKWTSITYGNGLFVAVSTTGAGNRVMTSTLPLVTPSVTIAANLGNSITTGTSLTFTATPTNGGSTPAYQWKKNNNNVGANSVNYNYAALENGDIITFELKSNDPCASPTTATSSGITMAVSNPLPMILTKLCS